MPIDTSIYSIPLNTPDPLSGLQKVAALKAAQQQQLIGAEQLKGARIENQERLQSIADDDAAKKLFAGVQAGGAMPGDSEILGTLGPKHGSVIVKALRDADKAKVDLQKTKSEVAEKEADYSGGLAAMVKDAKYSPAAVQLAIKHAHDAGYEQEAQQLQQLLAPENQDKIPALMDALIAKSPAQQKLMSERMTAQSHADQAASTKKKTDAELPGIEAQAAQHQMVATGMAGGAITNQGDWDTWRAGLKPEIQSKIPATYSPAAAQLVQQLGLTPDQRLTLQGQAAGRTETARHNTVEETQGAKRLGYEGQRVGLEGQRVGLEKQRLGMEFGPMGGAAGVAAAANGAHGEEFLKTVPGAVGDQIKALAEGRMAFPAGGALRAPYWQNMLRAVAQYDPSFDAVNYNARASTRKAFTSGKEGTQLNALNTVIGHLDSLSQAADSLHNTSVPLLNTVGNWFSSNAGDPRVKRFDATKKAVTDELTRVWRGSGGSEGDIKTWAATLDAANSPAQLHGVIQQMGELLQSKINSLGDQYQQGMGTTSQGLRLLTPQAEATLQKLEGKAAGKRSAPAATAPAAGALPQGGGKVIDPATAAKFYSSAGGDPNRARAMAQQAGWKVN